MPGVDLPLKDMNQELQLSAPPQINTFKMGDSVRLVLLNFSDTSVVLPQGYGVHIFQKVNDKWVIVENRMGYPSGEIEVLPKSGGPFREVLVVVHPIAFSDQPVTIRIVVVGNDYFIESGKTGEQRGAFIDVTLEPK